MVNITSTTTENRGRRIVRSVHYNLSYIVQNAERGSDGAIVLLHDIAAGAFSWEGVLSQLAGTGRAVYAFDMLGFGLSDQPWPADTSIWGHADVLAFALKELNLTNVTLIGHGLGGGVAQVLATRLARERVASLVLIDTIAYLHTFDANWPLPNMEKNQDPDYPREVKLEDLIQNLRETLPKGSYRGQDFTKSNLVDSYLSPWNSDEGKEVLFQQIRLLHAYYLNAVASDLKTLTIPVLIIWGEQDQQTPVKLARRLHHDIPNSQLVILPGAGHLALFDVPEALGGALKDFIDRL